MLMLHCLHVRQILEITQVSLHLSTDVPLGFSEIWVLIYPYKMSGTASKLNIKMIKYLMSSIFKEEHYHGIRVVRVTLTNILPLSTGCTEQSH